MGRTSIGAHLQLNRKLEGVHCTALIDTGSTVTLVRPDILLLTPCPGDHAVRWSVAPVKGKSQGSERHWEKMGTP
ncbi:UNVERIFIED_CONTAM: hypothetical protein FKN15_012038 [Acipenser sinensis]